MNKRIAAAVGFMLVAGLGLSACTTTNSPGTTPTTTPQLSPAEAFTAALGKLKEQGFDATMSEPSQGVTIKASVDTAKNSAAQTATVDVGGQTLTLAATLVGTDAWFKLDLGPLNASVPIDKTKWYHVDLSKLNADAKPFDVTGADLLGIAGIFTSVTNITRTDATHLAGTVDLTKATGPEKPDQSTLSTAGSAAASVSFTATLDDQGRLTELKTTPADANKDLGIDITFSNYGSPTTINAPPAADVLPAPDAVYQVLNGGR